MVKTWNKKHFKTEKGMAVKIELSDHGDIREDKRDRTYFLLNYGCQMITLV